MGGLVLKEKLKSLCCSHGWSYGVFLCFDQRNSMLLTMEDAYYEEEMGAVVNNMLSEAHMLGDGIVGQAASTGKHQWIFSDASGGGWNSAASIGGQEIFQYIPHMIRGERAVFDQFAVIFSVVIVWVYAHLLTISGAYKHAGPKT